MSGKKIYTYTVPPRETVIDIHGHVIGAGNIAKLYKREYDKLVTEVENGNNKVT